MWKKILNIIFGILILVLLFLSGYMFYQLKHLDAPEVIYMHDTITIRKDSIVEKLKFVTYYDTILDIHYKDSIIHDTIKIPIEHKVDSFTIQKDSLKIMEKIHHSGFKSTIDSVELNYEWQYTFQPKKQRKWGLVWFVGPTVTGGVNFNVNNKTFDYGPSVGLSVGVGIGGIIK